MSELEGKRILVVGASSGIGREVAHTAAMSGARVVAAARRADRLADLDAVAISADVRIESDCHRLVDEARDVLGALDGVVYCVGTSMLKPLDSATMDDWRAVFEPNVFGAGLVLAHAAPSLLATGGRAVVLSSKATRAPYAMLSLYTTSKFALDGLLRCLPREFPGLQVSRVVVGNTIGTDFSTAWDPADLAVAVERWEADGLLDDMGLLEVPQVAAAVLFALGSTALIDEIAVMDTRPQDDGLAEPA